MLNDILTMVSFDILHKPMWMWGMFFLLVIGLLVLDLGVFYRKDHEIDVKESLILSSFYIGIGLLFGGWVWWSLGDHKAIEYLTGFVVEKTLAMDNIFVIAMIFSYFAVPRLYQHRVLFWGILGVILLRGLVIGFGTALVDRFDWILYIFSAFLIFTGIKMLIVDEEETDIGDNAVLRFMQKYFRITKNLHGHDFFVRKLEQSSEHKILYVTPLFVALCMIEIADVVFAVDSIPAVFAITTDPYIVYTSNIFAILGLRALYFTLAAMLHRFVYLTYALSVVLVFIGSKIFITDVFDLVKFPPVLSLIITVGILGVGIILSLLKTEKVQE